MVVAVAKVSAPQHSDDPYFYIPVPDTASLYDFMYTEEVGTEQVEFCFFARFIDANEFIGNPAGWVHPVFFMNYWAFEDQCKQIEAISRPSRS